MTPDRAFEDAYPQVCKKHTRDDVDDDVDDVSTIHPLSFVFSAAVSDKQDPHLFPWLLGALLYGMTTITDKSIFKYGS